MDARKVEVSAVLGSVDVEKVEYFAVGHVGVPVQHGAQAHPHAEACGMPHTCHMPHYY